MSGSPGRPAGVRARLVHTSDLDDDSRADAWRMLTDAYGGDIAKFVTPAVKAEVDARVVAGGRKGH